MLRRIQDCARALGIAAVWSIALALGTWSAAGAQSSVASGDVAKELRFPRRGEYRHPEYVRQRYDQMGDVTRLRLGIASGNQLSLIFKPIVQLDLEAIFDGTRPHAAPDSIVVTSRVFRLEIAVNPSHVRQPQVERIAAGAPGPKLSFLVADRSDPAGNQPWRASLASVVTGGRELVRADDTGIYYRGKRWLATVANIVDLRTKPGEELSLSLVARADTGHVSLYMLPGGVQKLLRDGFTLTISEDVHRSTIPIGALLQMANAQKGVKTRFGTVDFTIEGDDLDALHDFGSRLAPDGALVSEVAPPTAPAAASVQPSDTRDEGGTPHGVIPAGTIMELGNSYYICANGLKPGQDILTILTKAVSSGTGAVVPAEAMVSLVVREIHAGDRAIGSIRILTDVNLLAFEGRSYHLNADVVEMELKPSGSGHDACIPKDGRILIKLRGPLTLEP